jgi:hypothetical protein
MGDKKNPNELVTMKVRRRHRDKFKSDASRNGQTIIERFGELV